MATCKLLNKSNLGAQELISAGSAWALPPNRHIGKMGGASRPVSDKPLSESAVFYPRQY